MSLNPPAIVLLLTGLIYYIVSWIQYKYPPKKINHFYGYRTQTSMLNQEIWDFSQIYSAEKLKQLGLYIILLGVIVAFFDVNEKWAIWISIVLVTLAPFFMMFAIERVLKKRFPKNNSQL